MGKTMEKTLIETNKFVMLIKQDEKSISPSMRNNQGNNNRLLFITLYLNQQTRMIIIVLN